MMKPAGIGMAILALVLSPVVSSGEPLASAVTKDDIDVANCRVLRNGKPGALDTNLMLYSLGLAATYPQPWLRWSAGSIQDESKDGETFQYVVAFKKPTPLGALVTTSQKVAYLKPDAPFPGDPSKPAQWTELDVPWAGGPRLGALPAEVQTRAVLFTDVLRFGHSQVGPARFFKGRFYNPAPLAGARAKTEYAAPDNFGARLHRAIDVLRAQGDWACNGVNEMGNINGPFISDLQPQWFVMGWDEPHTIAGLYLQDNFADFRFDVFTGPEGVSPLAGVDSEWTALKAKQVTTSVLQGRWVTFAEPVKTTGLRIRILKATVLLPGGRSGASQVASIDSLLAFEDLGAAPAPRIVTEPPLPPVAIPYNLPQDGLLTLAVDGVDGQRVRNLAARVERKAGANREPWDMMDEDGRLVPAGTYHWKAITAPPLELRYQMTVYPNVTVHHPENSAWLNGAAGPGGWLADHSPPRGGCAGGDYVFLGAPCPESGVGFICCDVTGKKLWGISSFAAWSAGNSMATDGKTVFVESMGFGAYGSPDEGADRVWGVDIATHQWKTVLIAQNTEKRRRGVSGIAARDGKCYLAVSGTDNWLANAAGWDAVDVTKCLPFHKEARKPKYPYEIPPDPRDDFLRLFRLKGVPPGCYALTYLESTLGSGRKEHVMLTFTKPVDVGCCIFPAVTAKDYRMRISALKADAPYPPKPNKKDHWVEFDTHGKLAWDVAIAPTNTSTRALLFTFYKGEDDDLSQVLEGEEGTEKEGPSGDLLADSPGMEIEKKDNWRGQLEGMKILRRRFTNMWETAKITVSSGTVDKNGVWDAKRTEPLSRENPGVYMMEWTEPQPIRGLAIREIDGKLTEIDAYAGPEGKPIDLKGTEGWGKIAQYEQARRDHHSGFVSANMNARYMDGYVDFGKEVKARAIRLRVLEQWIDHAPDSRGMRPDLGGMTLDPARCRLYGIAPLKYLGGDPPVDPLIAERIEVVDGATGKVEKEIGIAKPGPMAFGPDGTFYVVTEGKVVKVELNGGKRQPVIADVKQPGPVACDSQGNLYVFEKAPDQRVIRVYDKTGKFLRQIGEAGGYKVGPWNPNRFQDLTALAVDKENKVWAVDGTYWPKRISCWTADGKFLREYMGPTCYGSAGVLDPGDKRRLFYGPLEFEIDWESGKSRLKNLTWAPEDGWAAGEMPIRINNRLYLVNRASDANMTMGCGIVYVYEQDRLRRVAAFGQAGGFAPLKAGEIIQALGKRVLAGLQFIWTDRNGDGVPQFAECDFQDSHIPNLTMFDHKMEAQAGPYRYEIKEFLPNGVPVYQERKLPLPYTPGYGAGIYYRLDNGNYYCFGIEKTQPEACFTPDGKRMWTYKHEGAGVGPDRTCGPYTPAQVVCQFYITGHETAPEGDLGEFYVINANLGSWNIWTVDGLLAGRLFRDLRDPKRVSWTMLEHDRGMRLDDVTTGQEHFQGWFCRSVQDGKYYAVAGHNHASIVEVSGIEKFKRLSGDIKITEAEVKKAQEWQKDVIKFKAKENAKVMDCYSIEETGLGKNWEGMPVARQEEDPLNRGKQVSFQMCHDKTSLYLRYVVRGAGPFKNTGEQWDRIFKSGACVDLMLGVKSEADPKRRAPVEGDKRVLVSMMQGKAVVVLYDAVVPGTPKEQRWEAVSPVGRTEFDSVRKVEDAGVDYQIILGDPANPKSVIGHIVEISLPLKAIGLNIQPGTRIKLDWGILETDSQGSAVLGRTYWANKATSTLADAPTEARLEPDMWGWALFPGQNKESPSLADPGSMLNTGKPELDNLNLDGD